METGKTKVVTNERWIFNPIGVYLMSCYAYEELDSPFLTDHEFDKLGQYIAANWETLQHPHKHLIDPDSCMFTSGITQPYHTWPLRILSATHQLTERPGGNAWQRALAYHLPPMPKAAQNPVQSAVDDLI